MLEHYPFALETDTGPDERRACRRLEEACFAYADRVVAASGESVGKSISQSVSQSVSQSCVRAYEWCVGMYACARTYE